jgi:MFS transporter, MFS domain-containing protein family, molybdate-anion transporter
VSMMLGSLIYTFTTAHWFRPDPTLTLQKHTRSSSVSSLSPQGNSTLMLHAQLSALVCAAAAVTFSACVSVGKGKSEQGEHLKFWAFCLFEACVGMYYPVQGMLRGSLIANEHRATVSVFSSRMCESVLRRATAIGFIPRTAQRICRRVFVDGSVFCP